MAWKHTLAPVSPHSWKAGQTLKVLGAQRRGAPRQVWTTSIQHSCRVSNPMPARDPKNSLWLRKWNKDQEGDTFCDQSLCSGEGCLKTLEQCPSVVVFPSDLVLTLGNRVWSSFCACLLNQKMTAFVDINTLVLIRSPVIQFYGPLSSHDSWHWLGCNILNITPRGIRFLGGFISVNTLMNTFILHVP